MPARRKSPRRSKSRSKSPRRVLKRRSSGKARTSVTRRRSPKRTYKGTDTRLYGMQAEPSHAEITRLKTENERFDNVENIYGGFNILKWLRSVRGKQTSTLDGIPIEKMPSVDAFKDKIILLHKSIYTIRNAPDWISLLRDEAETLGRVDHDGFDQMNGDPFSPDSLTIDDGVTARVVNRRDPRVDGTYLIDTDVKFPNPPTYRKFLNRTALDTYDLVLKKSSNKQLRFRVGTMGQLASLSSHLSSGIGSPPEMPKMQTRVNDIVEYLRSYTGGEDIYVWVYEVDKDKPRVDLPLLELPSEVWEVRNDPIVVATNAVTSGFMKDVTRQAPLTLPPPIARYVNEKGDAVGSGKLSA